MQVTTGSNPAVWVPPHPSPPKSWFCDIKLFPSKKAFHETFHVSPTDKPCNSKCWFSVLTLLLTKLENDFRGLNPVKHLRWRVLLSAVNYFCKTLHLRCLAVFWIHLRFGPKQFKKILWSILLGQYRDNLGLNEMTLFANCKETEE